jgi:hypothetical protein
MNRMLLAFFIVIATSQANAEPASEQSAHQLLKVARTEAMLDSMYSTMERIMQGAMQQAVAGKPITPEQQRIIDTVPARLFSIMRSELSWDKLEPEYVRLYTQTFDQSEIDGLIAFYQTPAGQAYLSKMPSVMQKSVAIGQMHMQALAPKMKEAIDQALIEANLAR